MADVFVSYAREDAAKAKALARALEQASFDVWFDERIYSGTEYSSEIEQALNSAAVIVVLWSASSVVSGWVRDEAAEGRDSGRLVPVVLDDCRPPIGFRQIQSTDLSHWSGRGRPKQIDDVVASVRAKAGAAPAASKPVQGAKARRRRPLLLAAALAVVIAAVAVFLFFLRFNQPTHSAPSVALLPFAADASDPEARKLAAAAHDAVAHTLSKGAFTLRLIESVPLTGRPPADFMISGQFSSSPEKVSATLRMEDAARHALVFSDQFDAPRKQAWELPERIGAQIASQLSWTAPLIAVDRRHPSDPAVTASLLQQVSTLGSDLGVLQEYETARRLATRAPNSPIAQLGLAMNTAFALDQIPQQDRRAAVTKARRAADRALALAPEFGDVHIPWCLLHSEQRMVECEDRLRTGMRADPDAPFVDSFLSLLLNNVGRNREAAELASLSLAHDEYMPAKIARMLRMLEAVGRTDEATELYRQSVRWWPDNGQISWSRLTGMAMRGDLGAVWQFARQLEGANRPEIGPIPALASAARTGSAAQARKACEKQAPEGLTGVLCMLALAQVGDPDTAFRFADQLYPSRRRRTLADEERIWLDDPAPLQPGFLTSPAAAPLRRDPRYLALAQRVGLLPYWRTGRLPDFCKGRPEPVCAGIASPAAKQ